MLDHALEGDEGSVSPGEAFVDDGHVIVLIGGAAVLGGDYKAVIDALYHLHLSLYHVHVLQLGPMELVVLGHRKLRNLNDVGVLGILYWLIAPHQRAPSHTGARNGGSQGQQRYHHHTQEATGLH